MALPAWLAYVPLPGLSWVVALTAPTDRFTRFHARQGGAITLAAWLGLVVLGLLGAASDAGGYQVFVGIVSFLWLTAALAAVGFGAVGAARGLYVRVRPAWDALARFGG